MPYLLGTDLRAAAAPQASLHRGGGGAPRGGVLPEVPRTRRGSDLWFHRSLDGSRAQAQDQNGIIKSVCQYNNNRPTYKWSGNIACGSLRTKQSDRKCRNSRFGDGVPEFNPDDGAL